MLYYRLISLLVIISLQLWEALFMSTWNGSMTLAAETIEYIFDSLPKATIMPNLMAVIQKIKSKRNHWSGMKAVIYLFNLFRAQFFIENTKLHLQFPSFLHFDITHVIKILSHVRQELAYSTVLVSPGHQQLWYWQFRSTIIWHQHV